MMGLFQTHQQALEMLRFDELEKSQTDLVGTRKWNRFRPDHPTPYIEGFAPFRQGQGKVHRGLGFESHGDGKSATVSTQIISQRFHLRFIDTQLCTDKKLSSI